MGEPQWNEEQKQPSAAKELAKGVAKDVAVKTTKKLVKKGLFIKIGIPTIILIILVCIFLIVAMLFAGTTLLSQKDEEAGGEGSGWQVGTISALGEGEIPAEFIPLYKAAAEKYSIPWNLIAGIHKVETNFSSIKHMISPVGATGHFQFMPCTWVGWSHPTCSGLGLGSIPKSELTNPLVIKSHNGYGVDGNGDGIASPDDLEDAIYSAANYLSASGAKDGNLRKAVYSYNHANWYVDKVLGYANSYVEGGYKAVSAVKGASTAKASGAKFLWPVPGHMGVTSRQGWRVDPVYGDMRYHGGMDIAGGGIMGKPTIAAADGKITYAGWMGGYGNTVMLDIGGGTVILYGHMTSISVSNGQSIKAGSEIGKVGSTGKSTGAHLHFEVRVGSQVVDPEKYLKGYKLNFL